MDNGIIPLLTVFALHEPTSKNQENKIGGELYILLFFLVAFVMTQFYILYLSDYYEQKNWGQDFSSNPSDNKNTFIIILYFGDWLKLIFVILLTGLFILKRNIFPLMGILFLASTLVFDLVTFVWQSLGDVSPLKLEYKLGMSIIYAIIWIPYFIFSKRVKRTFMTPHQSTNGFASPFRKK